MMKRLVVVICYILIIVLPKFTYAGDIEKYEEASTISVYI